MRARRAGKNTPLPESRAVARCYDWSVDRVESIWTRYLGLFVGDSAYAQVIVLVIFLGGMSLGALIVGRRSERVARPLCWYAVVELATGAIGLAFHDRFVGTTACVSPSCCPRLSAGGAGAAPMGRRER